MRSTGYTPSIKRKARPQNSIQALPDMKSPPYREIKEAMLSRITVVILLAVVSAGLVAQHAPVQAGTSTLGYGADVNPTGDPIGGGYGYSNIVTSGDYSVDTKAELLAALSTAASGQVIYIEPTANIDMGGGTYGTLSLAVPSGVTIASNRGWNGSPGGRIYWSMPTVLPHFKHFFVAGNNVTFNGIRLQGPDGSIGTTGSDPLIDGIFCSGKTGLVVENCEIYNWPYAGIAYYSDRLSGLDSPSKAHIHHNYIHNCRRAGLGYGVQVGASSALIEANVFDYCRHAIAGERGYPTSNYEARFNVVEPNITNVMFDMHGGNDTPSWGFADGPDASVPAGGTILIHHNTFKSSSQLAVGIRGVPADICRVYNNWTYWPASESSTTFKQRLENLGLTPYVRMEVYDNWLDTAPPPATSHQPTLNTIGPGTVRTGETLTFTVSATDPDGDALTYSASNLPQGASFNPTTRTFSWTPTDDQAGLYSDISFQVSDGSLTDSQTISITVMSTSVQPDVNGDSDVNVLDMIRIGQHWSEVGANGWIVEDVNQDGTVDVLDATLVGQHWTG